MAHDVFISYKSEDQDIAMKICKDLESRGLKCWISHRDVRGGDNHQVMIPPAIEEAGLMVLVFSSNADRSDEIGKEILIANDSKKPWIPVRIEDILPTNKLRYEMSNRQFINLFNNWDIEINRLIDDIYHKLGKQPASPNGDLGVVVNNNINEEKFIDILTMAYSDGEISSSERIILSKKCEQLGITSERSLELEEKVKSELSAEASEATVDSVPEEKSTSAEVEWPLAGHVFLNSIKSKINLSLLPFNPTFITDDIEDEKNAPQLSWSINDKYYFEVWLPKKRKDKVDVRWGLYSENEKRDPLFRKTVDKLYEMSDLLDTDEDISIDGIKFIFNTEDGYLGIETQVRKSISEINDTDFVNLVTGNLVSFAAKTWPVVKENLL